MKAAQQQLVIGRELATGGDAAAHKLRDNPKGARPPMIGHNGAIRALEAALIMIPAVCRSGGDLWFVKIRLDPAHAWHQQGSLEGGRLPLLACGFSPFPDRAPGAGGLGMFPTLGGSELGERPAREEHAMDGLHVFGNCRPRWDSSILLAAAGCPPSDAQDGCYA